MSWSKRYQWQIRDGGRSPITAEDAFQCWGNRISLPPSALESLMQNNHDFSRVTILELRTSKTKCFAGVADFSSPDDLITVPEAIVEALGLNPEKQYSTDSEITVRLGKVPHATHLTFKPLTADFLDIDTNVDSFLTRVLPKQFVTLSPGQIIKLRHDGQDYSLLVTDVKPKNDAVLIIDTNVAVTFDPPSEDTTSTRRRMQQLKLNEDIVDTAYPGQEFLQYWISIPPTIDLSTEDVIVTAKTEELVSINTGNKLGTNTTTSSNVSTASSNTSSDTSSVEVFIGLKRRARLVEHLWAITTPGGGSIALIDDNITFPEDIALYHSADIPSQISTASTTNATNISESNTLPPRTSQLYPVSGSYRTFYLSVHSDGKQEVRFRLNVNVVPRTVPSTHTSTTTTNPGGDTKQCSNCQAWVPSNAYSMHTAVCARNNVRCNHPGCGVVLRKGSKEANDHGHCDICSETMLPSYINKHKALWHTDLVCEEGCGVKLPLRLMHTHANEECPRRMITCRFCNDRVRSGGRPTDAYDRAKNLTVHEAACGSRTRTCTYCKPRRGVLYKMYDEHMLAAHPEIITTKTTNNHTNTSSSSSTDTSNVNMNTDNTATTPTVTGVGGVTYNSTKEWQCDRCTFVNVLSNRSCELCHNNRPTNVGNPQSEITDNGVELGRPDSLLQNATSPTSPLGAINNSLQSNNNYNDNSMNIDNDINTDSTAYINLPSVNTQACSNKTCAGRATIITDYTNPRSQWKLCNRCYNDIVLSLHSHPSNSPIDEDFEHIKERVMEVLLSRYMTQISEGCNYPYCRNPYCVKGDSNANRNNRNLSLNTELALLISDANDGIFHICVGSNARFTNASNRKTTTTIASGPSSSNNSQRTSPSVNTIANTNNNLYGPSTTQEGLTLPATTTSTPTTLLSNTNTAPIPSAPPFNASTINNNNRSRTSSIADSRKGGTAKSRVAGEFFG